MNLLKFILKKKILIGLMTVMVLSFGLYAIFDLGKELMPSVAKDSIYIKTAAGDLSAIEVERNITDPLERKLKGIDGIKSIDSTTNIGGNSFKLTIEDGRGEEVLKEVESVVNAAKGELIGIKDIVTGQYGTNQGYELFMDISGGDFDQMKAFAKDVLEPRLENLEEVRDVEFSGLSEQEVLIEINKNELEKNNLNFAQVVEVIEEVNSDYTLGELSVEKDSPSLRWDTKFENIEDIENIMIPSETGFIQLKDIASIKKQTVEGSSSVWKDGKKDFIFVQIGRTSNFTQIDMRDAVRKEIQKIRDENLIKDFTLKEIVSQADYVEESIDGITSNIIIGGAIAIVILLIFLRNLRATFIIGLAIPTSVLLTFASMWLFDYSFNMLTLIGLGLGIGMMVDSSIVILESIYRKKELGLGNFEAVLQGTKEVAGAVIASILTTIIVFVPVGLISGEIGQYVVILSVIVAITLISSLIVSFTLIPSLSEKFLLFKKSKNDRTEGVFLKTYGKAVSWAVHKKYRSLLILLLFFAIFGSSLFLVPKIPMTIMPDMFNRYTEVMTYLETGVNNKEKEELVKGMNQKLQKIEDVDSNYILDMGGELYSIINMTKGDEIKNEQNAVNEEILKSLRELKDTFPIVSVQSALSDGEGGQPIQITVSGEDFSQLKEIVDRFTKKLESVEGIVGITNSMERSTNEQVIALKQDEIEKAGLSQLAIKRHIEQALLQMPVGEMKIDHQDASLILGVDESIETKESLLDLKIPTVRGEEKLSTFINLETVQTPNEIYHLEGERFITISADIENKDLGTVNREVQKLINKFETPSGYNISVAGDLEQQQELMIEMMIVLAFAIFLVYFVMAVQFNQLGQPIIVMSAIPMAFTGVILGLSATQMELNILSGIGVVMLIGIVLNNAILLIDRSNQLRRAGYNIEEALVEAGKNRLRPIFMTTITTVGGMLPLALESGTSGNYQAPLAVVIISGLLFSTFITLLLIPSICRLFSFSRKESLTRVEDKKTLTN
ncbi:efflux RND transporter permease subunit [Bacillus aquiflavi]|uniref:Efflux RND transporter permease subunit n=1 Tax=Bacillus aquiflavi TaxID=2672567 RepID=A0A6B3W1X7_9BACI|nr:efflux RND transporter permease subunit [Bacillus aquiflavi]MBA4537130.1 efflux RND transporter permease subunit [Bacillus aquiflavi]NEY82715.1 efflux RND transporter permease subunit [Bacillus aquiflavi]